MDFLMRRQEEETAGAYGQAGLATEYYQPSTGDVLGAYTQESYKGVGTGYADYMALQVAGQEQSGKALSADEYKASPYYRDSIPYYRNMTPESAKTLAEYNDEREQNAFIMNKASGMQTAAGFITGFGAGVFEPKNIATGVAASAVLSPLLGWAAPVGSSLRRVLQLKKVAGNYGAKAAIGATEGALGALLAEPTNQYSANILKQDYGMADTMLNIGLGAAFGAGFNTVPGFIKEKWNTHKANTPDIVAHEIDTATNQLVLGQKVDVSPVEAGSHLSNKINPIAKLTGGEIGENILPENRVHSARDYYLNNLQNTTVERAGFGTVQFTGKGWQKLKSGLGMDEDKFKLIPAIKEIIASGDYQGRTPIDKARTDKIIAFHYFEADVEVAGKILKAGVNVGEDNKGNLFYNLNKNPGELLQNKKLRSDRGIALGPEPIASDADINLTQNTQEVNLDSKPLSFINNEEAKRVLSKHTQDSLSPENDTALDNTAARTIAEHTETIKDTNPEADFKDYMDEVRGMKEQGLVSDKEFESLMDAMDNFNEADLQQIHGDLYACLTRG